MHLALGQEKTKIVGVSCSTNCRPVVIFSMSQLTSLHKLWTNFIREQTLSPYPAHQAVILQVNSLLCCMINFFVRAKERSQIQILKSKQGKKFNRSRAFKNFPILFFCVTKPSPLFLSDSRTQH